MYNNFNRSDRGFNRSDKGFNRSDRGFNRSDNSTKQDKSYIINNKQFPNLDTLQKEFSKPLSPKWNYTVIQDHILTDETDWENKLRTLINKYLNIYINQQHDKYMLNHPKSLIFR